MFVHLKPTDESPFASGESEFGELSASDVLKRRYGKLSTCLAYRQT